MQGGAAIGMQAQGNYGDIKGVVAPRTISSAASRMDALNERLVGLRKMVDDIADQIGGPRPTAGQVAKDSPEPNSAVTRLNGLADRAHEITSDIEETLKAIARNL